MKSYRRRSHGTTFWSLVLELPENLISKLDEVQCGIVIDSIGGFIE